MTHTSDQQPNQRSDEFLDLLLDALLQRQQIRQEDSAPVPSTAEDPPPSPSKSPHSDTLGDTSIPTVSSANAEVTGMSEETPATVADSSTAPLSSIRLGRTLGRLALLVVALVVAINIPFNRHGTTLATVLPDTASLVIRDGLVLKGSGSDIYVLEDDKLRWISSLDAFEHFGFRWDEVHVVDDTFLDNFQTGKPLHVLLKCSGSPHIYALEAGHKRWIRDILTFESEGYQWHDVKTVDCQVLRDLPDGHPIPPDAGTPPQP